MALEKPLITNITNTGSRVGVIAALSAASAVFVPSSAGAQPQAAPVCPTETLSGTRRTAMNMFQQALGWYSCARAPNIAPSEVDARNWHALTLMHQTVIDAGTRDSALPELAFNLRQIALTTFRISPVQRPLAIGNISMGGGTPDQVAARYRENELVKAGNLTRINDHIDSLLPANVRPGSAEANVALARVNEHRAVLIYLAQQVDANLSRLWPIFRDSIMPVAQDLRVCGDVRRANIAGDQLTILSDFLCARAGNLTYEQFLRIATDPNLRAALPAGRAWPTVIRNSGPQTMFGLTTLDIPENANVENLVSVINQNFYLLYLYVHAVQRIDALSVRLGGVSLANSMALTNTLNHPQSAEVIGREPQRPAQQTNPLVRPDPIAPSVINVTNTTVESPAHIAWRRAIEARAGRIRLMRIIGLSAAGAGVVTASVSFGLNVAERSEAEGIINTPAWQARVAETNSFIAAARAGTLTLEEITTGNERTARYLREYRAAVDSHSGTTTATQIAAWTGVGVAIFGGALALLAPMIAGPVPVEPRERTVPAPAGTPATPHPAAPGRRADNEESSTSVIPNLSVTGNGVQFGATVTF